MKPKKLYLSDLITATLQECERLKYGPDTIENCRDTWFAFNRYCQAIGEDYYKEQIASRFLYDLFDFPKSKPKSKMASSIIRSMRMLGDYNLFERFLSLKNDHIWVTTDDFQIAISNYIKRCEERGNCAETIQRGCWSLYRITDYFVKNNVLSCNDITSELVVDYVSSLLRFSKKSMQREIRVLRLFLNLMYIHGQRNDDLSLIIPSFFNPQKPIPTTWTTDEIQRILASVDRNNPVGKRDYCIILFAVRYGMRTDDIRKFSLDNINWEHSYIEFSQAKTKNTVKLPLTDEVGTAIIDYLKYARPNTISNNLFVKMIAPYDELKGMYAVFQKYLRLANISTETTPCHGLHSLRHTLATTLLENDVKPYIISEILGHVNLESIKPYLKININKLKECALNDVQDGDIYE